MKSKFNPYVWSVLLINDFKNWGRCPYTMLLFYADYHNWEEGFTKQVEYHLDEFFSK